MRHQRLAAALLLVPLLALGGCADPGRAIPRPDGPVSTTSPGASPAPSPVSARSAGAGPESTDDGWRIVDGTECTDLTWRAIKGHIDDPAVAIVGMQDDCRKVSIETTLDKTSTAVGVSICTKAAEVAWDLGAREITVSASDASLLASATSERACTSPE